jgi:hypothetical protein
MLFQEGRHQGADAFIVIDNQDAGAKAHGGKNGVHRSRMPAPCSGGFSPLQQSCNIGHGGEIWQQRRGGRVPAP